jgi:FkbM family methyltransferase
MKSPKLPQKTLIEKYEIKPGAEVFEYVRSWFALKRLAKKVAANERKFFLDVSSGVDRSILNLGVFEKAIINIIKEVCTKTGYTDQLIDIGANIGNHSVCLASVFKKIAAVEPNPVIFKVLEANVLRNNITHATCYNFGLAEHASSATLVATSENHSLGKVKQHTTIGAGVFNIDESAFDIEHAIQLESTSTFFEKCMGKNCKTFIKIDVEGMEQEILTQLLPFIRAEEPIVGFEWYVREQQGIKDIIASLANYTAYVIDSNDKQITNPLLKAVHLLWKGRKFSMKPYNPLLLKESYPLVMLIPSRLNLSESLADKDMREKMSS